MAITKQGFAPNIWKPVLGKTNGRCAYCEKKLDAELYGQCGQLSPPEGAWEVDHWIPKCKNGTDVLGNLVPACCECNDEKGEMSGEDYILQRNRKGQDINLPFALGMGIAESRVARSV